jgi:hypothetical protein
LIDSLAHLVESTSRIVTNCPSGNCTFPDFAGISHSSIGICTRCKDITFEKVEGGGPPEPKYYVEEGYPYTYNYTLSKSNITIYNTEKGYGAWLKVKTSRTFNKGFGHWEEP